MMIRYGDDKVKFRNSSFPNPTKMISSDKPFHSNDFKVAKISFFFA
jgi:hypothetical protein